MSASRGGTVEAAFERWDEQGRFMLGFRGSGSGPQRVESAVWGLGFRVYGLACRAQGCAAMSCNAL